MRDLGRTDLRDANLAVALRSFGQDAADDFKSRLGQEEREDYAAIELVYDLRAHGPRAVV